MIEYFKLAPSQTEIVKEEDLLANIAYKLVQLMDSKIPVINLIIYYNINKYY